MQKAISYLVFDLLNVTHRKSRHRVCFNRDSSMCNFIPTPISSLKIHHNLAKMALYFSHYLIKNLKFTADEIMAKVQDQFQGVKMDFKTRNSSEKKILRESLLIGCLCTNKSIPQWAPAATELREGTQTKGLIGKYKVHHTILLHQVHIAVILW